MGIKEIWQFSWEFVRDFPQGVVGFVKEFKYDAHEQKVGDGFRAFAKGFLELIRNVAVVSAIKFFATRAESMPLHLVADLGKAAIAITLGTYVTRFRFAGWDRLTSPKLSWTLGFIYTVFPGFVAYFFLGKFIEYVVAEIVRSQLMH